MNDVCRDMSDYMSDGKKKGRRKVDNSIITKHLLSDTDGTGLLSLAKADKLNWMS